MSIQILRALQSQFHSSVHEQCLYHCFWLSVLLPKSSRLHYNFSVSFSPLLQLDLLVSEFLVSRYLVSYFFVFDVGKAVTYMKTTIVMRRRFGMRFKMTEAEYSGLSVKSFNCSGPVTERRRS